MDAYLRRVGDAVLFLGPLVFEVNPPLRIVLAEEVGLLVFVAGRDQLFQSVAILHLQQLAGHGRLRKSF